MTEPDRNSFVCETPLSSTSRVSFTQLIQVFSSSYQSPVCSSNPTITNVSLHASLSIVSHRQLISSASTKLFRKVHCVCIRSTCTHLSVAKVPDRTHSIQELSKKFWWKRKKMSAEKNWHFMSCFMSPWAMYYTAKMPSTIQQQCTSEISLTWDCNFNQFFIYTAMLSILSWFQEF